MNIYSKDVYFKFDGDYISQSSQWHYEAQEEIVDKLTQIFNSIANEIQSDSDGLFALVYTPDKKFGVYYAKFSGGTTGAIQYLLETHFEGKRQSLKW